MDTTSRFNRMSRKLAKATFQMQLWSIFLHSEIFLSARWDFFATSWDFLDVMGCFLQHPKLQPSSTFLSTLQCFEFPQQMALKASACFDWGLCWYLDFCQVTRDQFLSVFASFISLTIKRCHGVRFLILFRTLNVTPLLIFSYKSIDNDLSTLLIFLKGSISENFVNEYSWFELWSFIIIHWNLLKNLNDYFLDLEGSSILKVVTST